MDGLAPVLDFREGVEDRFEGPGVGALHGKAKWAFGVAVLAAKLEHRYLAVRVGVGSIGADYLLRWAERVEGLRKGWGPPIYLCRSQYPCAAANRLAHESNRLAHAPIS